MPQKVRRAFLAVKVFFAGQEDFFAQPAAGAFPEEFLTVPHSAGFFKKRVAGVDRTGGRDAQYCHLCTRKRGAQASRLCLAQGCVVPNGPS